MRARRQEGSHRLTLTLYKHVYARVERRAPLASPSPYTTPIVKNIYIYITQYLQVLTSIAPTPCKKSG